MILGIITLLNVLALLFSAYHFYNTIHQMTKKYGKKHPSLYSWVLSLSPFFLVVGSMGFLLSNVVSEEAFYFMLLLKNGSVFLLSYWVYNFHSRKK